MKKPTKDMIPDLYCINKMVERLEAQSSKRNIGIIVSLALCLGEKDYQTKILLSDTSAVDDGNHGRSVLHQSNIQN